MVLAIMRATVDFRVLPIPFSQKVRLSSVVNRPRFGCDSQARTPQLGRDYLYRTRQVLDR